MNAKDKHEYKLEYIPFDKDLSNGLARRGMRVPRGPFLLERAPEAALLSRGDTGDFIIHGNSKVKVTQDGWDFSNTYSTWRKVRAWTVQVKGDEIPSDGTGGSGWSEDNANGTPSWSDMPGRIEPGPPSKWARRSELLEFVVSVRHHEEQFGAVYFFVITSTAPNLFRSQMSIGKNIPFKMWDTIQRTTRPWTKESGCPIIVDSGWKSWH